MNHLAKLVSTGASPIDIRSVGLSQDLVVVVFAPHPDDFDAVAITLRVFRDRGNPIDLAVLSSGASGVEDDFCSPPTPEKKAQVREVEQRASCRLFGLPPERLCFLRLKEESRAPATVAGENLVEVRQYLTAKRPDIVFLPHGNDTNAGHRRAYAMLCDTVSATGVSLTAFLNRDPKTIDMRHDLYTAFSEEDAQWKAELLRCHQSQHQRNLNHRGHGMDERILNIDRQSARELGCDEDFAEVFELEVLSAK